MDPSDWIATIALLVSVGTAGFSLWNARRLQDRQQRFETTRTRVAALEQAKIVVAKYTAEINRIMNGVAIDAAVKEHNGGDLAALKEVFSLYAETNDLYLGIKHHFDLPFQQDIDAKLEEIGGKDMFEYFLNAMSREDVDSNLIVVWARNVIAFPQFFLEKIDEQIARCHS